MTTVKKAAPKKAAKIELFPNMRCHHRDGSGKPDCAKKREKASVNLCPTHQAAWAKAARERAAKPTATKAPKSAGTSAKAAGVKSPRKPTRNSGGQVRKSAPPVPELHVAPIPVVKANVAEPALMQLVALSE